MTYGTRSQTLACVLLRRVATLLAGLLLIPAGRAATVSEPSTVIYGRIVHAHQGREFWVTRGELVWTLRTSVPEVREHRFTVTLRAQADGRASYVLRIPHQLLARGLDVASDRVAVPAAGEHRLEHVSVTLDGQPLRLAPSVTADLRVSSAARAGALRFDLVWAGPSVDSDGDGAPDAWEDAHGLDKWDPRDAVEDPATPDASDALAAARAASNFGAWRAALFPQDVRPLEVAAADDPDQDGIPNLVEYAFSLDPSRGDVGLGVAGPTVVTDGGRPQLRFHPRSGATDLEFGLDVAEHLGAWREAGDAWENGLDPASPGAVVLRPRAGVEIPEHQFYRVRVLRR